ncbi:hypothetical protein ABJ873_004162 [Escherichia coli]|nr:hypothetical protein [Escherichia coli]EFC3727166.1 hypothetical protein [Escherichia coli]EFH7402519.1 hypothetical protein [Escherichia coli]EFK1981797.1 hypothetical protein [Escherichia coli]EFK4693338.1 hypothetical protein [Escherichia coli]
MYKKVLISLIGVGGAFFSSISNGEADVQQNIKNAASEVRTENAVTVENSATLITPAVTSEEYKRELEEFRKLQQDNIKLKLQTENNELAKKMGNAAGISNVRLISIYSTSNGIKTAQVYGGGEGFRELNVGDIVSEDYTIQKITNKNIVVYSDDKKEEKILNLVYLGG